MQKMWVRFLDQEDPLKKETVTHSSVLTWEIPWTEEPWGHKELDVTEHVGMQADQSGSCNSVSRGKIIGAEHVCSHEKEE